ncbi:MAG TPA: hypothetical protein VMU13_02225 [Candidatus Paceibacterota bacterium]|nr:hypothetical protein [Candidatus Paceibacterota bacterium]
METERSSGSGFFGLGTTAVLAVLVLVGALGWQIEQIFQNKNTLLTVVAGAAAAHSDNTGGSANDFSSNYAMGAPAETTTDPYAPSQIGDNVAAALAQEYAMLKASGSYSSTTATQVATALGANLKADVTYETYHMGDIPTASDTSYTAMLAYRAKLQVSLKPLIKNTTPEIDLLTHYVQTSDPSYLTQLQHAADTYASVASSTAQIIVPADAVSVQLGILNAMQEFSATLNQMVASANDPLTEATLINTYMQAQTDMFTSFNNLYGYYKSKQS